MSAPKNRVHDQRRSERQAALTAAHRAAKAARAGCSRHHQRWTATDEKLLRSLWGERAVESIGRKLGRHPHAVQDRARKLGLGGACERSGLVTAGEIAKRTGYNVLRVQTAARRLGLQGHHPPSSRGGYASVAAFDEDEAEKIEAFLAQVPDGEYLFAEPTVRGAWGERRKPARCTVCQRNDRPHYAHGKCQACYARTRRAERRWGEGGCAPRCEKCRETTSRPVTLRCCRRCKGREEKQRAREEREVRRAA